MVHLADHFDEPGVQRCRRCGYILTDYRNVMVPDGTPPLRGWEVGAAIEVITGNPTYLGVTDASPDCRSLH